MKHPSKLPTRRLKAIRNAVKKHNPASKETVKEIIGDAAMLLAAIALIAACAAAVSYHPGAAVALLAAFAVLFVISLFSLGF